MKRAVPGSSVADTGDEQVVAFARFRGDRFLARSLVLADRHVDTRRLVLAFAWLVLFGRRFDVLFGVVLGVALVLFLVLFLVLVLAFVRLLAGLALAVGIKRQDRDRNAAGAGQHAGKPRRELAVGAVIHGNEK